MLRFAANFSGFFCEIPMRKPTEKFKTAVKKQRAVAYLRVSTEDQKTKNQLHDISAYCDYHKISEPKVYKDEGISGHKARPALDRMMADAELGLFDVVLVWRFDRAGRSSIHLLQLVDRLNALKIRFISVTENIDTECNVGYLMYTIMAAFAQFESNIISERTIAGMRIAKQEGKLSKPRKRSFDYDEALRLHFEEKMPVKEVADKLGVRYQTIQKLIWKAKKGGHI